MRSPERMPQAKGDRPGRATDVEKWPELPAPDSRYLAID